MGCASKQIVDSSDHMVEVIAASRVDPRPEHLEMPVGSAAKPSLKRSIGIYSRFHRFVRRENHDEIQLMVKSVCVARRRIPQRLKIAEGNLVNFIEYQYQS
jgi:hypothetical protein